MRGRIHNHQHTLYLQKQAIYVNLDTKRKRGTYKAALVPKAFMYLVDAAARQYDREFGSGKGSLRGIFDKPTREWLAQELAKEYAARH